MTTTIDQAGRLVIPKPVRDAAGILPGVPVEIRFRDGRIEIEPAPIPVRIEARGRVAVAVAEGPPIAAAVVEGVRGRLRRERG
jgi:AbrB family looped-hinge helix DNA binding protein